jgi:outer membrane protein
MLALALLITAALPRNAASAPDGPLTLDQAIGLALQKNEGLLIERESLAAAKSSVTAAKGAYDPLLALDGGWRKSTEPLNSSFAGAPAGRLAPETETTEGGAALQQLLPTGGLLSLRARGSRETTDQTFTPLSPAFGSQMGVELRQPLLRDRGIDAARLSVRRASAGREGASASLRRVTTETVAAVEQAYWRLVAARLGVEVREESVRLAQQQLEETQTRVETGSVPRTELAQPRAELERRRGELLEAREAAGRADNTLKLLILDGSDDARWSQPLAPVEDTTLDVNAVDVAAAVARALNDRPELGIARANLKSRRAETAFAKNEVWPRLDALAAYDRFGLDGSSNPDSPTAPTGLEGDLGGSFESLKDNDFNAARVAIQLGLPIGNRAARGNAAVARHVERQAEADLSRVRKAIRAEVLDAAVTLETAGQRIEAARSSREAAEIQLSAERDRYATGMSTNFLVLTRQNDLSRARLDEISARTDYRTARTEIARATGSLLSDRNIQIDANDRGGSR